MKLIWKLFVRHLASSIIFLRQLTFLLRRFCLRHLSVQESHLVSAMPARDKHGVASFQKKHNVEDYHVEFDENWPVGGKSSLFMSWFGVRFKQVFSYYIDTNNFEKKNKWEELWLDAKVLFFFSL